MVIKNMKFNPKVHICKFGFEKYDYAGTNSYRYNIIADLYLRELTFEFINNRTASVENVVGYVLSDEKLDSLLPLLAWDEYEKYRDCPEQSVTEYVSGYRDGWGYKFWCLSETGDTMIQKDMNFTYKANHKPPYEKLFEWVKHNYCHKKRLRSLKL